MSWWITEVVYLWRLKSRNGWSDYLSIRTENKGKRLAWPGLAHKMLDYSLNRWLDETCQWLESMQLVSRCLQAKRTLMLWDIRRELAILRVLQLKKEPQEPELGRVSCLLLCQVNLFENERLFTCETLLEEAWKGWFQSVQSTIVHVGNLKEKRNLHS